MTTTGETFEVAGTIAVWRPPGGRRGTWYFLPVRGQAAAEIRYAALGRAGPFGAIRVTAAIGATRWATSLFSTDQGRGYILLLSADVRRREGLDADMPITATLTL